MIQRLIATKSIRSFQDEADHGHVWSAGGEGNSQATLHEEESAWISGGGQEARRAHDHSDGGR